jgi:predicted HAD superfamily Cof-like phosphohydrolase
MTDQTTQHADADLLVSVAAFMAGAGCTMEGFNVRQSALYTGLQLEEMAEKIAALARGATTGSVGGWLCLKLHDDMVRIANRFKNGDFDDLVRGADPTELLDANIDLAWVSLGAAFSEGADVAGACNEVARANLDKFVNGVALRDSNGKIMKPEGWCPPDMHAFIAPDTDNEPTA